MEAAPAGQIIVLNGPSSAGKSTLARAIQAQAELPFLRFSPDLLLFGGEVLPPRHGRGGPFAWEKMRPQLFEGYFRCLPALAGAGNNLVVDFIIETREQLERLVALLGGFDVFLVGVHCPLPELERREALRGDRGLGDARRDLQSVHSFTVYDFEVDSSRPADEIAEEIIAAWQQRTHPTTFERLARDLQRT